MTAAEPTGTADAVPARTVTPLLEPRDGLPDVVADGRGLALATAALAAGTGPVAVDAERASGFRYGQRAYLVQFRRRGAGTVLIDPIACPDLSGVDRALRDDEAVLHAAGQDLPCLAEVGYRPQRLFDTELAGRLLGYPRVGLGTLVETVLGLGLEKRHAAADWSRRPLPAQWLRYAALDVEVLIELRDVLGSQLAAQGKAEWARQEFAAILAVKPASPRPDPWRRTSGIHRLRTRRSLAIVRELWQQRDQIARQRDLSPSRVLADAAIIDVARAIPRDIASLRALPAFGGQGPRRHEAQWLRAVRRAVALPEPTLPHLTAPPPDSGPPPAHRWRDREPEAALRLAATRGAIAALADAHGLPAENLLPPDAVRRLAWHPPATLNPPAVSADLAKYGARPWQVELTSAPITRALLRVAEKDDE